MQRAPGATSRPTVAVVGGGPGGLMAAERLAGAGFEVTVFEQMASVGRKLLLAGRGGLNLTHSEATAQLVERYGPAASVLGPVVERFDAAALRDWADGLGEPTFVGSSGRVFPESFRATPLLRAWLARLAELGVDIRVRHRWTGFVGDPAASRPTLSFVGDDGNDDGAAFEATFDAVVLSLGGASWPKVGSDGTWTVPLADAGVDLAPFRAANSGFLVPWTPVFIERFAGSPLKNVVCSIDGRTARGEAMVTDTGLEGGVIYAIGATLRDRVEADGSAVLSVDLQPDRSVADLVARLDRRRPKDSVATVLARVAGLAPVAVGLVREATSNDVPIESATLAALLKALPVRVTGVESIARAISTAGGVRLDAVDESFMLRARPGVFVAGEMLDWEAPTGGYLLQATFSTAVAAAEGVERWLAG